MNKVEEIIAATKLSELMNKKEEDKNCKTVLWGLAVIGAVAAVAAALVFKKKKRAIDSEQSEKEKEE